MSDTQRTIPARSGVILIEVRWEANEAFPIAEMEEAVSNGVEQMLEDLSVEFSSRPGAFMSTTTVDGLRHPGV